MNSEHEGREKPSATLPLRPERRVLIYRLGSLGDTVVALPCFHLIARCFPEAERRLLTNFPVHAKAPAAAAVLGDSGLVHSYMRYTAGTRNPLELAKLAVEIRRFRPDLLAYVMPVRPAAKVQRDVHFFRMAGVREIVGLEVAREVGRCHDPATGLYEHESYRLARGLAALGDAAPENLENWDLRLTSAERETARQELGELAGKPYLVCAPGPKMQANDWGQERWRELLARISRKHPALGLALVGAGEDFAAGNFAAQQWQGPLRNLCGRLSPRESAAAMDTACLFMGPDSGPMHLAASRGVPCVIVFGARNLPGVWYPTGDRHTPLYEKVDCAGCGLEVCVEQKRKCLAAISVDAVEAAAERALSNRALG